MASSGEAMKSMDDEVEVKSNGPATASLAEGTSNGQATEEPLDDVVKYTSVSYFSLRNFTRISTKGGFQSVFKAVVSATRCAKTLPKLGENYELYNSYPVFAELMTAEGERVLQL